MPLVHCCYETGRLRLGIAASEIKEIYQKLGDLVADGSLSAAVKHVYPLDQFKEAFKQSLKSNRSGKILFKFGATDVISK